MKFEVLQVGNRNNVSKILHVYVFVFVDVSKNHQLMANIQDIVAQSGQLRHLEEYEIEFVSIFHGRVVGESIVQS